MARSNRIGSLDFLRAFAVLWVLCCHALIHFVPDSAPAAFKAFCAAGTAGVDLFFVLSGYLIGRLLLSELDKTGTIKVGRFLLRRWLRTLPAYYATLLVVAIVDTAAHQSAADWGNPWSYLVFGQGYANAAANRNWHFAWSWSLCVEEWFYLLLPCVVALIWTIPALRRPRMIVSALAVGAAVTSVCARYGVMERGTDLAHFLEAYWTTHCRMDGIAAGLLVAVLPPMVKWERRHGVLGVLAILGLAYYIWVPHSMAFRFQEFVLLSTVFGLLVRLSVIQSAWAQYEVPGARVVADLSYSLYLVHPIAAKVVYQAGGTTMPFRMELFVVLSFLGAILLRRFVELPMLRLRESMTARG